MNRKFRLSVALDIDDVLMECVPYAIRLANEKYRFDRFYGQRENFDGKIPEP